MEKNDSGSSEKNHKTTNQGILINSTNLGNAFHCTSFETKKVIRNNAVEFLPDFKHSTSP